MYCYKTQPTAKSLASHVIFNGAVWSRCTKRVALASICLDSINAEFALSFHFKSKFDLGDNLVWPSLVAVSNWFNGVNLSAQFGIIPKYRRKARYFSGLTKFTIASTALANGEMPAALTWCPRKLNSVIPNWHLSGPIIIPYSAKRVKRIFKCFLCVRWSGLVTKRSSKYTNPKSNPRITWSIKRWKVWPEFLKPNGVLVKLNKSKGVVTAVLCTSNGSTGIW